jgi:hypothetical protein
MEIVEQSEKKALSSEELEKMLGDTKVKIIGYHELKKYQSLKEMFDISQYWIILLIIESDLSENGIGHWVALLNHTSHYEHFDPYGLSIDQETKYTNERHPLLKNLFLSSEKPIEVNTIKFQKIKENINTCGRWCVVRCKLGYMELKKFQSFIQISHTDPDVAITLLTIFL